jgi:hypothetical protein
MNDAQNHQCHRKSKIKFGVHKIKTAPFSCISDAGIKYITQSDFKKIKY